MGDTTMKRQYCLLPFDPNDASKCCTKSVLNLILVISKQNDTAAGLPL